MIICSKEIVCRSVYVELEFSGKTFDIPVHHYAIPERIFRASQEIKCFCPIVDDVRNFFFNYVNTIIVVVTYLN